jgi:hypothetical protein
VSYRVPLWVRGLLATDRAANRFVNVVESIVDETLLAWLPPEDRPALTAAIYSARATYLPGGERFEGGLFPWEERALADPSFPKSGRILLGGAGAGRELVALVERGYEVVAFDPCLAFADAAQRRCPASKAKVFHASYGDLVNAAAGAASPAGPLAGLTTEPEFDAVILGWGSLTHVMPSPARTALFRALKVFAPRGPVLSSFGLVSDPVALRAGAGAASRAGVGKGRVRDGLRRAFAALGAPGSPEERDHFLPSAGFLSYLTPAELRTLADASGYAIARYEESPYPHAVFVPTTSDFTRNGR